MPRCMRPQYCDDYSFPNINVCESEEDQAPGDTARYQLEYIMVRELYRNSVKNSHAYPDADVDTDHILMMITDFRTLKNVKARTMKKRLDRKTANVPGRL